MYRRVVSLFIVPCLLLTQSAALGHSHGGNEPAGHDLRPHTHLGSSCSDPAPYGHSHAPGADHRDGDSADGTAPGVVPGSTSQPGADHDADALYAADPLLCGWGQSGDDASWDNPGTPQALTVDHHDHGCRSLAVPHPSPHPAPDRPLYLRHLTLLI